MILSQWEFSLYPTSVIIFYTEFQHILWCNKQLHHRCAAIYRWMKWFSHLIERKSFTATLCFITLQGNSIQAPTCLLAIIRYHLQMLGNNKGFLFQEIILFLFVYRQYSPRTFAWLCKTKLGCFSKCWSILSCQEYSSFPSANL